MKYNIEIEVRAHGVQLIKLTEEEKEQLLKENDLDNVYGDWVNKCEYNFELEGRYLTPDVDRYYLTITDEDGENVFESEDVEDIEDKTYNEEGEEIQVEGWTFEGVEDGFYLARLQTIRGCFCYGEFELDEPFDESKLYRVLDEKISDELLGDSVYPFFKLYYQQGEGYDMNRDQIDLEDDGCDEEQYWQTLLLKLENRDEWTNLRKK